MVRQGTWIFPRSSGSMVHEALCAAIYILGYCDGDPEKEDNSVVIVVNLCSVGLTHLGFKHPKCRTSTGQVKVPFC